jgi:hypothetical protein
MPPITIEEGTRPETKEGARLENCSPGSSHDSGGQDEGPTDRVEREGAKGDNEAGWNERALPTDPPKRLLHETERDRPSRSPPMGERETIPWRTVGTGAKRYAAMKEVPRASTSESAASLSWAGVVDAVERDKAGAGGGDTAPPETSRLEQKRLGCELTASGSALPTVKGVVARDESSWTS